MKAIFAMISVSRGGNVPL